MTTIKDIAKYLGISHSTVSRALNDSPLIKEDTRRQVLQAAELLDYVPNMSAKNLVMQKSNIIGLFFSSMTEGTSDNFLVDVIKSINDSLESQYSLTVNGIDKLADNNKLSPQLFDGILIMSQSDEDDLFIKKVQQSDIPYVILNRHLNDSSLPNISSQDRQGVQTAIRYLFELGHRNIGFIKGKKGFRSTSERYLGYQDALQEKGLPLEPAFVSDGDYTIQSGQKAAEVLLAQEITAIFCSNDDMAFGALHACKKLGKRVPEDISIVGFDDSHFAAYSLPSLTTVHKPIQAISQLGVELLLKEIQTKHAISEQHLVKTSLVIRESTDIPPS